MTSTKYEFSMSVWSLVYFSVAKTVVQISSSDAYSGSETKKFTALWADYACVD
jgi:hypothetical protein